MSDEIYEIIAKIIGFLIGIAIMYGLYVWLGFEITLLLYLASINLSINELKELNKT